MNQTSPNSTLIACGPFAFIPLKATSISSEVHNVLIVAIAINAITCPFIILLNILVILAVKTKRRLRTNSNIVLACLATTDLVVGLTVQPLLIAGYSFKLKGDADDFCSILEINMLFTVKCISASFNQLLLMSGERYFAIKHPFVYESRVTEVRIILAAGVAWLAAILSPTETSFTEGDEVSANILLGIITVVIFFILMIYFNAAVYIEVRRIRKEIIANQVSLEAKEKSLRNKKAFYTTTVVLLVLFLCYFPGNFCIAILISYKDIIPANVGHVVLNLAPLLPILNSLFNPLVYAVRARDFRVVFIQLLSRKTVAQAENTERNIFGSRQIGVVPVTEQEYC